MLDIIIIAIFVIATIYGLAKGLIRQAFGVVAIIVGIWVTAKNFGRLASHLPLQNPTVASIASFVIIFVVTAIINYNTL